MQQPPPRQKKKKRSLRSGLRALKQKSQRRGRKASASGAEDEASVGSFNDSMDGSSTGPWEAESQNTFTSSFNPTRIPEGESDGTSITNTTNGGGSSFHSTQQDVSSKERSGKAPLVAADELADRPLYRLDSKQGIDIQRAGRMDSFTIASEVSGGQLSRISNDRINSLSRGTAQESEHWQTPATDYISREGSGERRKLPPGAVPLPGMAGMSNRAFTDTSASSVGAGMIGDMELADMGLASPSRPSTSTATPTKMSQAGGQGTPQVARSYRKKPATKSRTRRYTAEQRAEIREAAAANFNFNFLDRPIKNKRRYQQWKGNNVFFFKGRVMLGVHYRQLWLTMGMILVTWALFFGLIGPQLHMGYIWTGVVLCLLSIVFLIWTALLDPGIIPRRPPSQLVESMPLDMKEKMNYCPTCHIVRPARTKHCRHCNNCIAQFDHHCPWTGNCIGRRNYRFFFAFLLSIVLSVTFVLVISFSYLAESFFGLSHDAGLWNLFFEDDHHSKGGPYLVPVVIMWGMVIFLLVGGLLGFHILLLKRGQTTNEYLRGEKNRGGIAHKPFLHNCRELWCTSIHPSLLLPMHQFPTKEDEQKDLEAAVHAMSSLQEMMDEDSGDEGKV